MAPSLEPNDGAAVVELGLGRPDDLPPVALGIRDVAGAPAPLSLLRLRNRGRARPERPSVDVVDLLRGVDVERQRDAVPHPWQRRLLPRGALVSEAIERVQRQHYPPEEEGRPVVLAARQL